MRRIAVAVVLLLGACRPPPAEDAPASEDAFERAAAEMKKELGEDFIVQRTGVFVLAGNLSTRNLSRFKTETVEACARALWNDFFASKPEYPIRIYLFRDRASYRKWVKKLAGFEPHSPYGFYLPDSKSLMMNIATGGGTLVHEMTHALTAPDFADCPTWLFEGLGCLFEQCRVTPSGHIKGMVNWRLPVLRRGGFVPLEELVKMSDVEFRGENEPLNYANARYLCFYMQERGLLRKFYKTFRKAHNAGEDQTGWASFNKVIAAASVTPAEFEKNWHAWVKTLKWPIR